MRGVSYALLRRVLLRATVALSSSGAAMGFGACASSGAPSPTPTPTVDTGAMPDDAGPTLDSSGGVDSGSSDARPDAPDAKSPCDGYVGPSSLGGSSPSFVLADCGLVGNGSETGKSCLEFCREQNPAAADSSFLIIECGEGPDFSLPSGTAKCFANTAGRTPTGLELAPRSIETLGGFFAHAAEAEAASIDAFEILADELAFHGAPRRLVRAARAAAKDERRHADAMTALALAHGAVPRAVIVKRSPPRPLESIALENARVGCVEETFAALVAQWQADHAADQDVATTMRVIARDEARHAALAWRVHAWIVERLPNNHVQVALQRELATLAVRVQGEARFPMSGAPSDLEARALAEALSAELARAA